MKIWKKLLDWFQNASLIRKIMILVFAVGVLPISSSNSFGWTMVDDHVLNRDAVHVSEKWYEELEKPYNDWIDEISAQALPDPLNGFSIDLSGLETEVEKIEQTRLHYFLPILCGYYADPIQALAEANDALNQTEFNEYFETIQQQMTDYFADKS